MATPVLEEPPVLELDRARSRPPSPPVSFGNGGRGDAPIRFDPARFGVWAFLGTVSMLFIGFTSAYMLRRASADWAPLAAPPILWLNTALLGASSFALEGARRAWQGPGATRARTLFLASGLLGAAFVLGQFGAWRALRAQGVFLATNPHSSFFYMLTGIHILHLAGGLGWFLALSARLRRLAPAQGRDAIGLFATYWHFIGLLWAYLLFVLFVL
jgi:cytochrome c oxidase subunit III